jgi:hypothetical protein
MAGRTGFFGGLRGNDTPERDADTEFGLDGLIVGPPLVRLDNPNGGRSDGFGAASGFDPIWGTLGAAIPEALDDAEDEAEGPAVEVEIFGNGFQISGQIHTGQFDRLSGWINMQSGFIAIRDALHVHPGKAGAPDLDQRKGTLRVRLSQIVMMAERSAVQAPRPGAPVVQKQRRRVSIVTPGYRLEGNFHIHAHGAMTQFLESPDPHFLPITEVTVRGLSNAAMVARFPFAMVNREQLVTVLDESAPPSGDVEQTEARSA